MQSPAIERALRAGLRDLELSLSEDQVAALLEYLSLMQRWNSSFNLTSVRDPMQMVYRHLLDSLAVARYLPEDAGRVVDVGSGAGLPGVPLAIMQPERQFELLDSNGKKTRFLFQVKTALGLANMSAHQARAEAWQPPELFDIVLTRAFASLADMLDCCQHLCRPGGRFLAMKGLLPGDELAQLESRGNQFSVAAIFEIKVPGLSENRHLIDLRLSGSAPLAGETGKGIG